MFQSRKGSHRRIGVLCVRLCIDYHVCRILYCHKR